MTDVIGLLIDHQEMTSLKEQVTIQASLAVANPSATGTSGQPTKQWPRLAKTQGTRKQVKVSSSEVRIRHYVYLTTVIILACSHSILGRPLPSTSLFLKLTEGLLS